MMKDNTILLDSKENIDIKKLQKRFLEIKIQENILSDDQSKKKIEKR